MPTRYEYDADGNGQWRWIAVAANGATKAAAACRDASLEHRMHAVRSMQVPGNLAMAAAANRQRGGGRQGAAGSGPGRAPPAGLNCPPPPRVPPGTPQGPLRVTQRRLPVRVRHAAPPWLSHDIPLWCAPLASDGRSHNPGALVRGGAREPRDSVRLWISRRVPVPAGEVVPHHRVRARTAPRAAFQATPAAGGSASILSFPLPSPQS